jgi:pyruvate dehydrogenase E2 component (dihydrolipoamide acetyltransferase)
MIPVVLPQLSISMEEGKVVRWLVGDGDEVREGQPLVEVETDKATMEVEAPADGRIRLVIAEGAIVAVESTIAEILGGAAADAAPPPIEEPAVVAPALVREPAAAREPHRASPAARRIAQERGIDLSRVRGSGPGGRIVAADLERAAPKPSDTVSQGEAAAAAPSARGLRDAVLANITASWQQIPHIHIGGELAADGLAQAKRSAREGTTLTDLLVLALVQALQEVPELNGGSPRVNVALAVATPQGVVAPVLRDAAALTLDRISTERARLVAAARAGTSERRDLAGGTITLSNLGAYPVDFFAPVVSGPQAAMVATGRLAEKPVAVNGMLAVRHRLWVNVAIDHTKADGEAGARFLAALERALAQLPLTIEGAR